MIGPPPSPSRPGPGPGPRAVFSGIRRKCPFPLRPLACRLDISTMPVVLMVHATQPVWSESVVMIRCRPGRLELAVLRWQPSTCMQPCTRAALARTSMSMRALKHTLNPGPLHRVLRDAALVSHALQRPPPQLRYPWAGGGRRVAQGGSQRRREAGRDRVQGRGKGRGKGNGKGKGKGNPR